MCLDPYRWGLKTDPYKVLGVPRGATPDQVRAAYRRLARTLHPDVCAEPDAARRFAAIADAYERLTRLTQRAGIARAAPPREDPADASPDDVYDAYFNASARPRQRATTPRFVPVPGTRDLLLELPVGVVEAGEGANLRVPTPDGPRELLIPPGTPDGREFRMVGLGVRGRGGVRGDLLVRVRLSPGSGADFVSA